MRRDDAYYEESSLPPKETSASEAVQQQKVRNQMKIKLLPGFFWLLPLQLSGE